jgi:tripartite-type tricarboxylate transporter receptor subunit TctC
MGVPKDSPYNSLNDIIAAAKKTPGKINFAAQTGSMPHIAGKLLDSLADVNITHIPFRGGAQMHAAALAGDVNIIFDGITPLIPHFRSGALKPIAVTGSDRVEVLPNTPTVGEVVSGFEVASWFSLFGPANMDPNAVKAISAAIGKMVQRPDAKAKLIQMAVLPPSGDAEAARKRLQADFDKFGDVIKRANIKVE